jgi:hypothetical protein
MRLPILVISLSILLVAAAIVSTGNIPRAHAALTGLVCLQDQNSPGVSSGKPCSATSPTFDGPAPGSGQTLPSRIRIGVYLNASDAMNGFDITLFANHTILRPVGVDTAGTVVPGATTVIVECLGTTPIVGSCVPTDTIDTLQFALAAGFNQITTAPTTGLLFTAVYNITGTAPTSGISVGFQTGCGTTSHTPVCVTVAVGTTSTPNSENIQTASFNNHASPPWVAVSSNTTSLNFIAGSSTGNQAIIGSTGKNAWPGFSTDLITFSAQSSAGLNAVFSPSSCTTGGNSCSTLMSLNGAAGNYSLTVLGQYVLTDANFGGQTDSLAGPVALQVTVRDFGLTASPTSLSLNVGGSGSSSITLTSLNGFTGVVSLTANCPSSSTPPGGGSSGGGGRRIPMAPMGSVCPALSLSSSVVTISRGGLVPVTLNVSRPSVMGNYTVSVMGQTGSASPHGASVSLIIRDFNVSSSPSSLSIAVSSSGTLLVTVRSQNGFAGTVILAAMVFPSGPVVSFSPSSLTLAAGGSAASTAAISVPSGTPTGPYNILISASLGGSVHTTSVLVLVKPQGFLAIFTHILGQSGLSGALGFSLSGVIILLGFVRLSWRSRPRRSKKWTVGFRSAGSARIFPYFKVQTDKWDSLEDLRC